MDKGVAKISGRPETCIFVAVLLIIAVTTTESVLYLNA